MTPEEIRKFRRRIGDKIKSDSDITEADGTTATFHLRFNNVFDVTVFQNGSSTTAFTVDGDSGTVTFDTTPAEGDKLQFDYKYAAYTDTEIETLVDENGFQDGVIEALTELMADSARLYDYSEGATDAKLSQVFDHLQKLLESYKSGTGFAASDGTDIGSVKVGKRTHILYRSKRKSDEDLSRLK